MSRLIGKANASNRPPVETAEDAYQHLLRAIIDQRLLPGTKLTELGLMEALGVGRRMVAQALARLAWEKLIVIVVNRGAYVAAPDADEARDIFTARIAIEAGVTESVAQRRQPDAIAALQANIDEEAAMRREGATREAIRLSGGFHLVMAQHSGSAILAEQVRLLVARTSLVIGLFENEAGLSCWHDHHQDLVDHCREGCVDEAVAVMKSHIKELENGIALDRRRPTSFDLSGVFANNLS
jgi:DNA-binding GntR family transcriptional regulator